jgi:hypothetical protein
MRASRGMGVIMGSKMPKAKRTKRRDDTDFETFAEGGTVGLWDNINAKRKRGAKMRKPGSPGAPTDKAFKDSAK